jgi:hypothetical protein
MCMKSYSLSRLVTVLLFLPACSSKPGQNQDAAGADAVNKNDHSLIGEGTLPFDGAASCDFTLEALKEWGTQGYIYRRTPAKEKIGGVHQPYGPPSETWSSAEKVKMPDAIYAPLGGLYDEMFPSGEAAAAGVEAPSYAVEEFYRTFFRKAGQLLQVVHEEFRDATPPDAGSLIYQRVGVYRAVYRLEIADTAATYTLKKLCGTSPVESLGDVSGPMRLEVDPGCKVHWRLEYSDEERKTGGQFIQAQGTLDGCNPIPTPP